MLSTRAYHTRKATEDLFRQVEGLIVTGEETGLHVLTLEVVRAGIATLQGQRIHEHFPAYLHVRQRALAAGSFTDIEPVWREVSELLKMPGGPPTKPNYRPFSSKNLKDPSHYWLNSNLPGSYAPSSLRKTLANFMLNPKGKGYELPQDHARQALDVLLKGTKVPAWALASYYLRNYGFSFEGKGGYGDLIAAFKMEFLFDQGADFEILFDYQQPPSFSEWFEPFVSRQE